MKFSVCLSTGFEGVMYPIPFAGPEDFVEQAKLCERLGYDSVWGNDHIMMWDDNSDDIAGLLLKWIEQHVEKKKGR